MPDCRGGVFAVFAKIPPPATHKCEMDGFSSDVACRVALKNPRIALAARHIVFPHSPFLLKSAWRKC